MRNTSIRSIAIATWNVVQEKKLDKISRYNHKNTWYEGDVTRNRATIRVYFVSSLHTVTYLYQNITYRLIRSNIKDL